MRLDIVWNWTLYEIGHFDIFQMKCVLWLCNTNKWIHLVRLWWNYRKIINYNLSNMHASSISLHLALSWFFMILLYFFSPSILYFISNFNCHCRDCNMILYSILLRSVGVFASIYRKALVTLRYRIWQFAYVVPVYSYVL